MSEGNKLIACRFFQEAWGGHVAVVDEIFAPDYLHTATSGNTGHGREHVKRNISTWRNYFPDFTFTIEEMIAEGDKVVTRWTARGTHRGEYQGIPPTGKQVVVTGVEIQIIVSGKIVEGWRKWDRLDLLQQLGASLIQ
jgi:steroid delta-isomerase-like uncharacterized protein